MFTATKHPAMRNTIGAGMQVQGPCVFEDGLQIDGLVVGDVMPSSTARTTSSSVVESFA